MGVKTLTPVGFGMRLTFITTLNHNVGDDFVREGLTHLLRSATSGQSVSFASVHKHDPITARRGLGWLRSKDDARKAHRLRRWDRKLPLWITPDRILEADVLVQSGAPVYWCHPTAHAADNEWFTPLLRRRIVASGRGVPFLNLAAGSAQGYHSDGSEFVQCDKDSAYIRELHRLSAITTVRDHLAQKVLRSLGLDAPVIPCSALFARDQLGVEPKEGEFVALNYMRKGGHYDFEGDADGAAWERAFKTAYEDLKSRERCLFICHNQAEVDAAKELDPEAPIFFSEDHRDYVQVYAKAKYGLMNRVHGAFVLASLGKPSFVIGTDSRARMAEEIGLRHAYVNDVDAKRLLETAQQLESERTSFPARIEAIRAKAAADYKKVLTPLESPATIKALRESSCILAPSH